MALTDKQKQSIAEAKARAREQNAKQAQINTSQSSNYSSTPSSSSQGGGYQSGPTQNGPQINNFQDYVNQNDIKINSREEYDGYLNQYNATYGTQNYNNGQSSYNGNGAQLDSTKINNLDNNAQYNNFTYTAPNGQTYTLNGYGSQIKKAVSDINTNGRPTNSGIAKSTQNNSYSSGTTSSGNTSNVNTSWTHNAANDQIGIGQMEKALSTREQDQKWYEQWKSAYETGKTYKGKTTGTSFNNEACRQKMEYYENKINQDNANIEQIQQKYGGAVQSIKINGKTGNDWLNTNISSSSTSSSVSTGNSSGTILTASTNPQVYGGNKKVTEIVGFLKANPDKTVTITYASGLTDEFSASDNINDLKDVFNNGADVRKISYKVDNTVSKSATPKVTTQDYGKNAKLDDVVDYLKSNPDKTVTITYASGLSDEFSAEDSIDDLKNAFSNSKNIEKIDYNSSSNSSKTTASKSKTSTSSTTSAKEIGKKEPQITVTTPDLSGLSDEDLINMYYTNDELYNMMEDGESFDYGKGQIGRYEVALARDSAYNEFQNRHPGADISAYTSKTISAETPGITSSITNDLRNLSNEELLQYRDMYANALMQYKSVYDTAPDGKNAIVITASNGEKITLTKEELRAAINDLDNSYYQCNQVINERQNSGTMVAETMGTAGIGKKIPLITMKKSKEYEKDNKNVDENTIAKLKSEMSSMNDREQELGKALNEAYADLNTIIYTENSTSEGGKNKKECEDLIVSIKDEISQLRAQRTNLSSKLAEYNNISEK